MALRVALCYVFLTQINPGWPNPSQAGVSVSAYQLLYKVLHLRVVCHVL